MLRRDNYRSLILQYVISPSTRVCRFQWPCGLTPRSATDVLLGLQVRIQLRVWIFDVVCCVASGLCDGLITRSEESYDVCVCVCLCLILYDLETTMSRARLQLGCCTRGDYTY
jgi:hypothetical protein